MVRAVRGAMSPASSAAIGLMFGLLAILVHSFTDFGQHIPAVAVLTAVTCAPMLNLAQLRSRELGRVSTSLPARGNLVARISAAAAIVVVAIWLGFACRSTVNADRAGMSPMHGRASAIQEMGRRQREYADIITAAQQAADARPGNVVYRYWLNFYRWKSITARPVGDAEQYFPRIVDELHAGRWLCPQHGPTYLLAARLEASIPDRNAQAASNLPPRL